jgi:glycosyltransferase involved in cell wall biosynthesis
MLNEKSELPKLVFAGKYGKGGAAFQDALAADPRLAGYVVVLHAPSDKDLAWLYQNCLFTAFPSQFEGWGLPVGEAAWFGKFSVASNATSIPEVCGDLIDYVDPHDPASIEAALQRVLSDPAYLAAREQRIVDATLRPWSAVADDIFEFATASTDALKSD